jgi:hypothetical protein
MKAHAKINRRIENKGYHADRAEAFASLDRFEQRKPAILAVLRKAHQQGPGTRPFDEAAASEGLKFFSCIYITRPIARKRTQPSPAIRERFNKLAVDMEQVRRALDDLFESDEFGYVLDAGERIGSAVVEDICKSITSLKGLEAAVRAACDDIRLKSGRPRDRALWPGDVVDLAALYAQITGCKPESGKGPFAEFVCSILSALGRTVSFGHTIDMIKAAQLTDEKISDSWASGNLKITIAPR